VAAVPDLYALVATERRRLADVLDGLTVEQWDTPSLCRGWSVRQVLAHLVCSAEATPIKGLGQMARSGFNFNKTNDRMARADTRSTSELLAAYRLNAASRVHAPGFGALSPLTDVTVHSGDILRPLGPPHDVPESISPIVMNLLVSPRGQLGFGKRGRLNGFGFNATDVTWRHGNGPTVAGPAESLIMMMAGRTVGFDGLQGDGVTQLRSRFD
jgi:uncharacterized protein (TIGR03083 family)